MVSETVTLKYYDPVMPMTLSVDASSCGVGAVILQNNCPIAFASKALLKHRSVGHKLKKNWQLLYLDVKNFISTHLADTSQLKVTISL